MNNTEASRKKILGLAQVIVLLGSSADHALDFIIVRLSLLPLIRLTTQIAILSLAHEATYCS